MRATYPAYLAASDLLSSTNKIIYINTLFLDLQKQNIYIRATFEGLQ
jgi:hypothetical protein